MKFNTTLGLFILACLLAGLIWFLDLRKGAEPERIRKDTRVVRITAEDVRRVDIQYDKLHMNCLKKDGGWRIEAPIRAKADDGRVERILTALETMTRCETITPEQRRERELGLKDYGLEPPMARFVAEDRLGREELLVGDVAPLGNLVYVKRAGSDEIIATSRSVLDVIPHAIQDLRERALLRRNIPGTSRLEIQGREKGFIQIVRVGDRWIIQQPVTARADSGMISRLLEALYAVKVEEFVWDPVVEEPGAKTPEPESGKPAGPRVELYGLGRDEAVARVTVWVAGDDVGKELILGRDVPPDNKQIYAKCGDGDSVYAISRNILDAFSLGVNELRDRLLFPFEPAAVRYAAFREGDRKLVLQRRAPNGWTLVEPMLWKADDRVVEDLMMKITRLTADGFVESSETNAAVFGLALPAYSIQIDTEVPGAVTNTVVPETTTAPADPRVPKTSPPRLLIAALGAGDAPVLAKFDNDPTVFQLTASAVRGVVTQLTEPLVYRDRTMLAVMPENIKRLSLLKDAKEEQIVRDDSGAWIASQPATNQVNKEVVEDVLLLIANLRALRIESGKARTLAACGLDKPARILTLGLTGETGIQKSILMGFRARTDGVYAMIQGEDVIFVLENGVMERLTRALTRPGAPPAARP